MPSQFTLCLSFGVLRIFGRKKVLKGSTREQKEESHISLILKKAIQKAFNITVTVDA